MARSAHAYVRGSTLKFYEWLAQAEGLRLPEGPAIWICGDCHVGNLGPVANSDGDIDIHIRDFDQTVIGNPTHDLVRLALSLAMAARSSDLPGVTTARMMEVLIEGYESAFSSRDHHSEAIEKPQSVRIALKSAHQRTWRHLADERIMGKTVRIPLGKRFWKSSRFERHSLELLFQHDDIQAMVTSLKYRNDSATIDFLDAAYWMKGCSSLGFMRFAALLDVGNKTVAGKDFCLMDIKEAVTAAAPRYAGHRMPRDNARRVVAGAKHLTPHLGDRMMATRLIDRSVFIRELLPQDLKLEIEHVSHVEAMRAARYLAHVVGRAHARQMEPATRQAWVNELARGRTKTLEAPSWLWDSVIDLVATHERAYLDHCKRYAREA